MFNNVQFTEAGMQYEGPGLMFCNKFRVVSCYGLLKVEGYQIIHGGWISLAIVKDGATATAHQLRQCFEEISSKGWEEIGGKITDKSN